MKHPFFPLRSLLAFAVACAPLACAASADDAFGSPTVKSDAGPTTHGDAGPHADGGGSTSDAPGGTSDGSSSSPTPGSSTDDSACAATGTNSDCQSCCADAHKDAYDAFVKALHDCACQSGNCDYKCATSFCASPSTDPTSSCNYCLGKVQSGACADAITAACSGSGPCAPFDGCVQTQCASLP